MREISPDKIRVRYLSWILAVVLAVLLTIGTYLYWQGAIIFTGLVIWIGGLAIIGLLFILGVRVAQRKGFIDGFRDGRDGLRKKS